MTTFLNTAATEPLRFHDVYRLSLVAPSHWFQPKDFDSAEFGAGLQAIYNGIAALGVTPYIAADPYQPGDLAAVIDFLVEQSSPASVADMVTVIEQASEGTGLSSSFTPRVIVAKVEQLVGRNTVAPGTAQAEQVVLSADAQAERATEQQAANAAAQAAGSWLTDLENTLGTAGKYLLVGGVAFGLYFLYTKGKQLKRIVG